MAEERESMEFDVVIVGAGPSGLSASIKLMQLSEQQGLDLNICVLEKSSDIGSHIISGAVVETHALDELLPDWGRRVMLLSERQLQGIRCLF